MTDQIGAMPPARLRHPEMHLGAGLGLSAGGRPKALLDFDFTTISALDSRISFTRASPATRINANGHVETVAAHQPRFSHDPVTLRSRGLLVEDQRTNVLLHSENFDAASWAKTRCSIASTSALTPGGSATAARIVEDGTTGVHGLSQTVTLNAGAHTRSVYLKPAGRSWAKLACGSLAIAYCDLSTGVMGSVSGTGAPTATIEAAGNGWLRVSLSFTVTAGAAAISLSCATSDGGDAYVGDGTSGLHLWGEQLEAGGFASSYIPTAGVAVMRMMDLPVVSATAISAELNRGAGTILVSCDFPKYNDAEPICIDDDSSANAVELYRKSATQIAAFVIKNSVVQVDSAIIVGSSGKNFYLLSFKNNQTFLMDRFGGYISDTSCEIPEGLKFIRIGHYRGLAKSINGHVEILKYFGRYFDEEEGLIYIMD